MKQIVKQGELEKCSRNRGFFYSLSGKNYRKRMFKLFEDAKVQYFDGEVVRGEFSVIGGGFQALTPEQADGKENAFEITASDGEKLVAVADTFEEMEDWIFRLQLITTGKFRWYRHLDTLIDIISMQLPEGEHMQLTFEENPLIAAMKADGYGYERIDELLEQYMISLNNHVKRFVDDDREFAKLFQHKLFGHEIRVVPQIYSRTSSMKARGSLKSTDESGRSESARIESIKLNGPNFRTKFNEFGVLEIQYIKPWVDIQTLGFDLPDIIEVGEIPYKVLKSMRQWKSAYDTNIRALERLLGIVCVSIEFCILENLNEMKKNNFEIEKFGEIFFEDHMRPMIEQFRRCIGENPLYSQLFSKRFVTKTIILRPAKQPEQVKNFYSSRFTENGDLLIEYRSLLTNIHCLGQDFSELILSNEA